MRILVIDIGGSHFKFLATGHKKPVKMPSGAQLTPQRMVAHVKRSTSEYDAVSIGYPGGVHRGRIIEDAPNLGNGWVEFDFQKAFGCPVKIVNDSAMQALGSYRGGRMLFLGLGTGLGSTFILEGVVHAMELGDLPYRKGRIYTEYLGKAGRKRLGQARWAWHVAKAVTQFQAALQPEYTVVGGGAAAHPLRLPRGAVRGHNNKAFLGGFRLWEKPVLKGIRKKAKAR
jgi:predicted NBD/HSP70 family sugar kinase